MSKNRTPLDELAKLLENPSHNLSVDVYNENKKRRGRRVKKHNGEERMTLAKLAKDINSRFDSFENGINTRINNLEKDINTRLDYIVKANNLKDSK